ncbi:MAG: TMEM175 family protein [Acidobacteria bacterium]|nr:TMEM175 family protein [Acidobacteriota bacterium]
MAKKTYDHFAGQRVNRIEALSDGVFAIAMTLLVLDIKVPISEGIHSEKALLSAFAPLVPKLLSYLLGFMTLGIFWVGHSTQFNFINKTDRHLTWLSIFFLMFISVLPFSTAFLSEHIHFKVAIGLYWLNMFLGGMILLIHWNYACRKNLIEDSIEREIIYRALQKRIIYAQALYAAAALLCFVNNYLSVVLTILIQLNYALALFFRSENKELDLEAEE